MRGPIIGALYLRTVSLQSALRMVFAVTASNQLVVKHLGIEFSFRFMVAFMRLFMTIRLETRSPEMMNFDLNYTDSFGEDWMEWKAQCSRVFEFIRRSQVRLKEAMSAPSF
jgi:hypothetical protein